MRLQRDLAQKLPHARQMMAAESGHYVQFDDPEIVIGAIRELTESGRHSHPPSP